MKLTRRQFVKALSISACAFPGASIPGRLLGGSAASPLEAQYYEKVGDGKTHCLLCPNGCVKAPGEKGKCRARENRNGTYYSKVYGQPCVVAIDPVEKCPQFHLKPAENGFSIATAGCNLGCHYCQNWQFSQKSPEETKNFSLTPEEVIAKVKEYKVGTICFFYTEPTIYFEYMKAIAALAKKSGILTVMVTGGYINEKPLEELFPLIDAFTVGLKGFNGEFYETVIHGSLDPVLRTLKALKAAGKHLEVVTLVVPTLNDHMEFIQKEIDWYGANLGPDIPLHFTRFFPQFKLKGLPPTPVGILREARRKAMEAGMKFVYTGNVPGDEGNHTFCPNCRRAVIERLGFKVLKNTLKSGQCPDCRTPIPGFWSTKI